MLVNLVLAILLSLSIWIYIRWSRVKRHWAVRNVPHLPPHPVWGSLTFFLKENPALWFRSYYHRFETPFVGIWLFWRPAIIIHSFEMAQKILINDSDSFRDRFLGSVTKVPFKDNLLLAKDPIWTSVRRRLTTVFTSAKMKMFQNIISIKSHELVQRITNDTNNKKYIELKSLFVDYTTDVISITSFGVDSDAMLTGKGHMRNVTAGLSSFSMYKAISWCSIFYFPEIADIFRLPFFPREIVDYFKKIFKSVVAKRGGYEAHKTQIKDLLDALVVMKQEAAKDGEDMDEELLIAQAAVFLLGGFDTTAMILTFCVYELAFAPYKIQENLFDEITKAKEENNGKELDISVIANLPYLKCVLQETLRKYPGKGWIDRVATKTYKIDDDLTIPVGTPVYINSFGMHYDEKFYPEPNKFNPDRFLSEKNVHNKPFFSFGEGPRHCIGERLAMLSMRYALASMILNFKLQPLPNTPEPSECKFEKKYLLIQPGEMMSVEFVSRNSSNILKV